MALATGAQAELSYIEEVTEGTTPVTPAMKLVPTTGFSPELTKEGYQSGDLRADRQVVDFRHGFASTGLGLDFELKHGEFDSLLEAAFFGAFSTNVLKVGTTKKSFSMEARYTDIARYHLYNGLLVNSMSLSITTDATVNGSFGLLGRGVVASGTPIDAVPDAVGAKRSFDSFSGTINEGGAGIAIVTGLELSLENSLEAQKVIGSAGPVGYFDGRSNVTGTLNAFFEDDVLLDKFRNETPTSLEFVLTDPDGNTQTWKLPRIIYTGGSAPVQGEGGIAIGLPFQATFDPTDVTNIMVTRSI